MSYIYKIKCTSNFNLNFELALGNGLGLANAIST